jgi:hypothetical protein
VYGVQVAVQRPAETTRRVTENPVAVGLAPSIGIAPLSAPAGNITYTVTCTPQVLPLQQAVLLLGDREIQAQPHPTITGTLTFNASDVAAGTYFVRLRIDGVDSLLIDRSVKPPVFDPTQKVTVT